MSAPNTNVEKQRKRHTPAILGIVAAITLAAVFVVVAVTSEGVPLDEQAAADGVPTQIADEGDTQ